MDYLERIRILESKKTIEVILDALDNHMDSENEPTYPNPDGWFGMARLYYNSNDNVDHVKYNAVQKLIKYNILEKSKGDLRRDHIVRLTGCGLKIAYHLSATVELINNAN